MSKLKIKKPKFSKTFICHFCKQNSVREGSFQLELAPTHEMVYVCRLCYDEDKLMFVSKPN